MGNCQAADIAAIIVEYPNGRVEKVFLATLAHQLMAQNPGYFVVLVSSPSSSSSSSLATPPFLSASSSSSSSASSSSSFASSSSSTHPSSSLRAVSSTASSSADKSELPDSDGCTSERRFFKLLAGDAPLRVGHRYRLVSFEEVFTYFAQGGCDINFSRVGGNSSMSKAMQTRRPNYVSKYHHDQHHHHTNNTGKLARIHTVKTMKTGC